MCAYCKAGVREGRLRRELNVDLPDGKATGVPLEVPLKVDANEGRKGRLQYKLEHADSIRSVRIQR